MAPPRSPRIRRSPWLTRWSVIARRSMPDGPEMDAAVRGCLDEIADPCSMASASPMGLAEMGLVKAVTVSADGDVRIDLRLTSPTCNMLGFMAEEATRRVRELPGVRSVEVVA